MDNVELYTVRVNQVNTPQAAAICSCLQSASLIQTAVEVGSPVQYFWVCGWAEESERVSSW